MNARASNLLSGDGALEVSGLFVHFLKSIGDARQIRNQVIRNLEMACLPTTSDEEWRRLLFFVISGGGPTSVEFAAELYDMLNEDMCRHYPRLLRNEISVHAIQSRDHILNTYDDALSRFAEQHFAHNKVNVLTHSLVKEFFSDRIVFSQQDEDGKTVARELPMGFCLWSTGLSQTEFSTNIAKSLRTHQNNRRALETDTYLRLTGAPLGDVYAIGDCSTVQNDVSNHIVTFLRALTGSSDKGAESTEITYSDWQHVARRVRLRFPQTREHRRLDKLFEAYDKDQSGTLDVAELSELLKQIDSKLTSLPATAQRADQQGVYLGHKLNSLAQAMPRLSMNDISDGDIDASVYKAFE
jgi:NADH dehydrogenase